MIAVDDESVGQCLYGLKLAGHLLGPELDSRQFSLRRVTGEIIELVVQ